MHLSIFGLGYVGAVSCGCLASLGHHVIGVDSNPLKVKMINQGQSPVVEDRIDELIYTAKQTHCLHATQDIEYAVMHSEASLISVATPAQINYEPDLRAVEEVVRSIGTVLRKKKDPHVVILRSTLPPGTTESRIMPILLESSGRSIGKELSIVFNPEFLREGSSVRDFYHPPHTIAGSLNEEGYAAIEKIYGDLPSNVIRTSVKVAESVKYLCNVFHALKIVFANEAGSVLKACGLDSLEAMEIFCQDTQLNISPAYLRPGFAFGGSCLPKEIKGFLSVARHLDIPIPMLSSLLDSNESHINRAYRLIARHGRCHVALFGLAFKPGTDDMRDSPLVALAERLLGKGYALSIFDRSVKFSRLLGKNKEYIEREIPHLDRLLCDTPETALQKADVIVIGHADVDTRKSIIASVAGRRIVDLSGYADLRYISGAEYEGLCW